MTLTKIEYGSIASSEQINSNFEFLNSQISQVLNDMNINISSVLSNIATINSRLTELSEALADSIETSATQLEETKTKILLAINKSSFVPDWANIYSIESLANFVVSSNGYIIFNVGPDILGEITINQKPIVIAGLEKTIGSAVIIPVKENDVVNCEIAVNNTFFLPVCRFSLENSI